ncbi:MAG: hypothetical protein RL701_5788, partial [Pseudomonadota bacterium]
MLGSVPDFGRPPVHVHVPVHVPEGRNSGVERPMSGHGFWITNGSTFTIPRWISWYWR